MASLQPAGVCDGKKRVFIVILKGEEEASAMDEVFDLCVEGSENRVVECNFPFNGNRFYKLVTWGGSVCAVKPE